MKTNKKAILAAIVIVGGVFLGGCMSNVKEAQRTYTSAQQGALSYAAIAVKDFETKGMIFVESTVTIDAAGERTGSEITYQMLMKEAEKLGADDVINVRIDEVINDKAEDTYKTDINGDEAFESRKLISRNYVYQASALAIKYTKAIDGVSSDVTHKELPKTPVFIPVVNGKAPSKTDTAVAVATSVFSK